MQDVVFFDLMVILKKVGNRLKVFLEMMEERKTILDTILNWYGYSMAKRIHRRKGPRKRWKQDVGNEMNI